jgi:5-methylcytosine-specific restriction protein A
MTRALTVCNIPGCPVLVERGKCDEHRKADRKARPRDPYYSTPRWRAIRKQYLDRHPVCEEPACSAKATEVHHIDGIVTHDSYRNLKALCKPCHSRITLHPYQVSDTIRSGRPHLQKQKRLAGPGSQEPVIGGGLVEVIKQRKAEEAEPDLAMDEGWPDVGLSP